MKHSTERILTTHVGARPEPTPCTAASTKGTGSALRPRRARAAGREAVATWCGSRSKRASISSPTASRANRASSTYVIERFSGFERKPPAPGKKMQTAFDRAGSISLFPTTTPGPSASPNRSAGAAGAGTTSIPAPGPSVIKAMRRSRPTSPTSSGKEGRPPRGRFPAGDRFFLRRGYVCQRILPHPRGVPAGGIRRDARRVQGDCRRRIILQIDYPRLVTY